MLRMGVALWLLVVATLIAGCTRGDRTSGTSMSLNPVGEWRLVAFEGEAFELPDGAKLPELTIRDDGSVGGTAGINRFSASVDVDAWDENGWDIGPAAMTRMGGRPEAMAFEQRYIGLLEKAQSVYAWPETLDLMRAGSFVLRYERIGE